MKLYYSIIIPVYNEAKSTRFTKITQTIPQKRTRDNYSRYGSSDDSVNILSKCPFITLLKHNLNKGKGAALKGIKNSNNNATVIFDGDLELDPRQIDKLMILNSDENIECAFGTF